MAELQTKMEKRVQYRESVVQMREEGEKTPVLEGVAIVTEAETVLFEGKDWREIEVIDKSAVNQDFVDIQDIKLNLLHERSLSFGRYNKGKGELKLECREDGLHFEHPVDSDLAKQAEALVKNGTYTGCSFEFYPQDYTVEERKGADGKDEYVIRHTKFAAIGAITIGMDPAYEQTSVNARELYKEMHQDDEEKREAELAAEAAKKAEEDAAREAVRKETQRKALLYKKEVELMELENSRG